jgi:hypothetical protein
MWKRLGIWLLIGACLLSFPSIEVRADTSASVTITAVGVIVGAPGAFTLTYISDYQTGISWTMPVGAVNTMIRAAYGHVPTSITDGYQVYYGPGTSFTDNATTIASPEIVYYRAWSQRADGLWGPLWASGDTGGFMSLSFLFLVLVALAVFLLWFSSKRPELLIRLSATLVWWALGFWVVIGDITNLGLDKSWTQILVWVFFILGLVPLIMSMNTEIRHEANGKQWTEFGEYFRI